MKEDRKPLSFSMCKANREYIEEQVIERKQLNSRYSRSMYIDDLITHLRTNNKQTKPAKAKQPSKRFKIPTVEDVINYCNERCNNIDAQEFVDHYTANGWMRGKAKIKDWKACVHTWENNSNKKVNKGKTAGNLSACEDFING